MDVSRLALRNWSLSAKIVAISWISVVSIFIAIWLHVIPHVEARLLAERKAATKGVVDVACSSIAFFADKAARGELSRQEAQKQALANLRALHYGQRDYFWVHDLQPVMLMHPNVPELEGGTLADLKDANGKAVFIEMNRVVKAEGAGFYGYNWPKPGSMVPVPKVSYVKGVKPWGWVVGSGIYVDDVYTDIAYLKRDIMITTIALLLGILLFASVTARRINRPLKAALHIAAEAAGGKPAIALATHSSDETRQLLQAMETIVRELVCAKDAAEAASRSKSDFLSNMSHEIRTPMNAIIGMTEITLQTSLSREQRDCLDVVLNSSESLLGIINDILDFSKIEAGRLELEQTDFNLHMTIESTLDVLAFQAQQKELELLYRISPDIPGDLVGDPLRLRQVLVNLLGNAIKFTQSGAVMLTVAMVADSVESPAENTVTLRFSVSDSGIGISPQLLETIFDPFSQADGSISRKYGGTGLGLSISRRLVSKMQGELKVESLEGEGSVFSFTASFAIGRSQGATGFVPVPADRAMRFLVVDDNAINRMIVNDMLTGWGFSVMKADSGDAALSMLRQAVGEQRPFAVAIIDGCMPGMDGFELARQVKADRLIAETALIMLTSSGDNFRTACQSAGIAAGIRKPVKQSELYNLIVSVTSNGDAEQPALAEVPELQIPSYNILLAEDNPINQKVALHLLKKRGYSVDVVSNGREAIELLACRSFDFVLMDVQMPEMDGLEATRLIRGAEDDRINRAVPIIALTAHAMTSDLEDCLAAGMDAYISKPVRAADLYDVIENFSRHKRMAVGNDAYVVDFCTDGSMRV